jgi:hypothetical protein
MMEKPQSTFGLHLTHRALTAACAIAFLLASLGFACPGNTSFDASTSPASSPPTGSSNQDIYASPAGAGNNDGSRSRPMDLGTALSSTSPVGPGHTVWLLGGTYRGAFTSALVGRAEAPVIVRAVPGERAVLDGANPEAIQQGAVLTVTGAHTWFWGIEVTFSNPVRLDTGQPSRPNGIYVNESSDVKFIDMIVHDMPGQGFGVWTEGVRAEVYGSIIFHNGTNHFDHGIYTQNATDTKRIEDNVVFDQASHGIHAYGSDRAFLDHFLIAGNVSFNNGMLLGAPERNMLVGGGRVAQDLTVTGNYTYYPLGAPRGSNNLGYDAGCGQARVTGNYLAGSNALTLVNCSPSEMTGNTLVGSWNPGDLPARYPDNSYQTGLPSGSYVTVRPNRYERGRAHIVVYNWELQPQVSVDLAPSGLLSGERFDILDVQDLFDGPIVTGTYTGAPVLIPMTGLRVALPVWQGAVLPRHTAPEFAVFVVVPR